MVTEHDPEFVPLGNEPGPAVPLARDEAEALARAVVRRARGARGPAALQRWAMAAGVPLSWLAAGAAFAAVTVYVAVAPPASPEPKPTAQERAPERTARAKRAAAVQPERTVEAAEAMPAIEAEEPGAEAGDARPERAASTQPAMGASALLDRANRLRAAGEYRRAEQLYSRAISSSERPADALAAMVAAASLRLEHLQRPGSALALYERVLRLQPEGPLSASARFGVAQSHRALGEPRREAAALERFLLHHPDHLLAKRVAARLQELKQGTERRALD